MTRPSGCRGRSPTCRRRARRPRRRRAPRPGRPRRRRRPPGGHVAARPVRVMSATPSTGGMSVFGSPSPRRRPWPRRPRRPASSLATTMIGLELSPRPCSSRIFWPCDRVELLGVLLGGVEARRVELEHAEAGDGQHHGGADPDLARPRARSGGRPGPRTRRRSARAEPKVGRLGQKIQRPKITSSAGSRVTITSRVTADADREHRAEAGGGVHLGEASGRACRPRRSRRWR